LVKTILCAQCGRPHSYEPEILFGQEVFAPVECHECVAERIIAEQKAEKRRTLESRVRQWNKICPTIFHETDVSRLPAEVRAFAETWRSEDGRGLGFVGVTGRCKTRAAYLILRRYHFEGLKVKAMNAGRFGQIVLEKFSDDSRVKRDAERELADLRTAKLILLDDVAKERLTDRVAAELFGLINDRAEWKRPFLWTSNIDPAGLRQALGDDKGEPLIRRLREFTQIVKV
jgi:DNA replication protein DnaC